MKIFPRNFNYAIFTFIRKNYLLILIVILALFFRIWHLETLASFDFDQEIASWWIKSFLVDHKISLIGQEVSIGGVFLAPFFYYFLSIFYALFHLDPLAGNVAVALTSVVTVVFVYKAALNIFGQRPALLAAFFYAASDMIISYDRIVAPSNLEMLLSVFVLYLLSLKSLNLWKYFALGSILGLTFSIHPTAIFLIPIVIVVFFLKNIRPSFLSIAALLFSFMIFISPLILFDIRHHGLNFFGLFSYIFSAKGTSSILDVASKILSNTNVFYERFVVMFLARSNIWFKLFSLPVSILFLFWIWKKPKLRKTLFPWITISIIGLSVFRFHVPEYYFLLVFPIVLIYFSAFISKLPNKILICFLLLFSLLNLISYSRHDSPYTLNYKKEIVRYILHHSNGNSLWVDYDTDPNFQTGYSYLLYLYGGKVDHNSQNRFLIISPMDRSLDTDLGVVIGRTRII